MRTIRKRALAYQSGIAMLDCLIYLSLLAIVLGMAFAGFYAVFENTVRLNRNAADICRALHAGEQWREDVRRASATPEPFEWQGQPALYLKQATGEVVYFLHSNIVYRAIGTNTPVAFLPRVTSSQMKIDQRLQLASCRWELELAPKKGSVSRVKPLFTFQAIPASALK